MKRQATTFIVCLLGVVVLFGSTALAQNDIEDPNHFPGIWYRIALDEQGVYMLGDGHGYAGGTWYNYPQVDEDGWWRQWFYNGPYDANRKGHLDYAVYIKAVNANLRTQVEVRFNWTTPEWSQLGKRRPPLPCDVVTEGAESRYMQSKTLQCIENWFIGTVEPIKQHTIPHYNPEWISVDVRGYNAYVYRGAGHSSLPKDPAMGACFNAQTSHCYTGYEYECVAPYTWGGRGSDCADYLVPEPFLAPVYRFWSGTRGKHLFTFSEREKDQIIAEAGDVFEFEGVVYFALMNDQDPSCRPVHRFWSDTLGVYFYTIVEAEREKLETMYSDVWTYEGPAFYAHPEGSQPAEAVPVHRFWSDALGYHFYTISERERDKLIAEYSHAWAYEGIAWYAYAP